MSSLESFLPKDAERRIMAEAAARDLAEAGRPPMTGSTYNPFGKASMDDHANVLQVLDDIPQHNESGLS